MATESQNTTKPDEMLAELEIWHTRPITPTRRLALGNLVLPVDPTPGFGGLLLGAVMAAHIIDVDEDLVPDIHRLITQIKRDERIVQPRLRHRYQVDRHGLSRSVHRLYGNGDELQFNFDSLGTALQQVLGSVYAIERLEMGVREQLSRVLHKAMNWRGPLGPSFISFIAGSQATSLSALADPRAWALEVLGFPVGTGRPSKREIRTRFRETLRQVHPDHGGASDVAAFNIAELDEARRVLMNL